MINDVITLMQPNFRIGKKCERELIYEVEMVDGKPVEKVIAVDIPKDHPKAFAVDTIVLIQTLHVGVCKLFVICKHDPKEFFLGNDEIYVQDLAYPNHSKISLKKHAVVSSYRRATLAGGNPDLVPVTKKVLQITEAFTEDGKSIGYVLTTGSGAQVLVFADQKAMPGFRSGSLFVPGFGEMITYKDLEFTDHKSS